MSTAGRYVDVAAAAAAIEVSTRTIERWRDAGHLRTNPAGEVSVDDVYDYHRDRRGRRVATGLIRRATRRGAASR